MLLLAGDVGGTSARFQWLAVGERKTERSAVHSYRSADFASFSDLLAQLLRDCGIDRVDVACFGLPGPVNEAEVTLTNLPWHIRVCLLKARLPLATVTLINDFQAAALGIDELAADALICLHEGRFDPAGNRLVVGAGTGLGVAPVYQRRGRFYPQSSEGGHMAFAPLDEEQERLLHWLHERWRHVSYEDLLSGSGLETLYLYHLRRMGRSEAPVLRAAEVHAAAERGEAAAVAALTCFVNIYGQFVGDAALLWPARAGIYIAGGIGGRIARWMRGSAFTEYFLAKDRMREVVEQMPVYLVTDELIGLKGALLQARRSAGLVEVP
ncbi:glucokinase [Desulfuromonas thiophila]|uniref:glucokinase n=1 Tax=Desulfuromonas thiophila TaxID=57664 RepID=UPI0024A82E40|nr:glucokinase [Desulfuromonas thiophila]